ncbi:mucin-3B [Archocentrus centrarchus]|uniref:mucin-3B n=1 Tax=Archocentrus centrarchus TaxID=63155 RepID=UPI0011EA10A1|nr:mucin-3B-like [Archocentrus centrarchus]
MVRTGTTSAESAQPITTNEITPTTYIDESATSSFVTNPEITTSSLSTFSSESTRVTETSPEHTTSTTEHPPTTLETSETTRSLNTEVPTIATTMVRTGTTSAESAPPMTTNEITPTTYMDQSTTTSTTEHRPTTLETSETTTSLNTEVSASSSTTTMVRTGTTSAESAQPITTSEITRTTYMDQSATSTFCPNCQCNLGSCVFNATLNGCQCLCQIHVFGDTCSFGESNIPIDTGRFPTRKANITLKINITYTEAFNNLSSHESLDFINKLENKLVGLCKEADPQSFKTVKVIKLSQGSVVAESVAEYIYENNETQIQFINTQLDGVLRNILQNQNNLNKISLAFNNASVQLNNLTLQSPPITNITDLEPFVNCSQFANYTAEISNGQWQCVGPCKTNPDYCHGHGECLNDIYKGPACRCYENSLEQFYGPQCDLFRRGPGFYGALFGSLAVALLLLIIIIIAVIIKKRHICTWKRSNSYKGRLRFLEEDFFDFSDRGADDFGVAGTYSSDSTLRQ